MRDRHHKILDPSSSLVFQLGKQINNQSNAAGIVYRFLDANSAWIVSPDSFVVFDSTYFIAIQIFGSILFYDRHLNVIKSCQDLLTNNTSDLDLEFPFRNERNSSRMEISFANLADRPTTICPIVFRNANLLGLSIAYQIDSYFKKNLIKFDQTNLTIVDLNTSIDILVLKDLFGVDLDATILNPDLFSRTSRFSFNCVLRSIHADVFRPFTDSLRELEFEDSDAFLSLCRRRGIAWIRSINWDVLVDEHELNSTNMSTSLEASFIVRAKFLRVSVSNEWLSEKLFQFGDDDGVDFCVFESFPFRQLVLFNLLNPVDSSHLRFSCVHLWLVKYYKLIRQFDFSYLYVSRLDSNMAQLVAACDFPRRLELCNKTRFNIENSSQSSKTGKFLKYL